MTDRTAAQIIAEEAALHIADCGDYAGVVSPSMTDEQVWEEMKLATLRLDLAVAHCMKLIGCDADRVDEARGDLRAVDPRVKAGFIAAQRAYQGE